MAQGFVKALNLFESQDGNSARGILNNLAGAGIATDVALFANNLRTFNFLDFTNYLASKVPYPVEGEEFYLNVNPELNTDGDFDNNPANSWLLSDPVQDLISYTISGGVANIQTSSSSIAGITNGAAIYQHLNVEVGQTYTTTINRKLLNLPVNGDGVVTVYIYDAPGFSTQNTAQQINVGYNSFEFTPTAETITLAIHVYGGDASIDDISTKITNVQDPADFDYIVIPTTETGKVPFANNTRIYLFDNNEDRVVYEAFNSNALDRFQLKKVISNVVQPDVSSWDEFNSLERKQFYVDAPVTFENLNSFSISRPELNDGSGGSGENSTVGSGDLGDLDTATSAAVVPTTATTFLKSPDAGQQDDIDGAVDTFYYKESRTIVTYKDNYFDRLFEVNGAVYIANDSEIEFNDTNKNSMPGLFIVSHGEAVRAFSDTNNPWSVRANEVLNPAATDGATTIPVIETVVTPESAAVLNLIFNGPEPHIYSSNSNVLRITATPTVNVQNTWTHKMPVTVNGETFYLLMTDQEPVFT